jgi:uncharacterized protein YbjT (DUF2867 family)
MPWTQHVEWLEGDSLDPDSYADALARSDGVVHTVGTLLENTAYKTMMGKASGGDAGGSPIVGLVSGLAGMAHNAQAQAQAQAQGGEAGTGAGAAMGGDESVCYEEVNRDTAAMVSIEAADCERVRSFVFISAAHAPPFVDERYLSTKREAEDIIQDLAPDLRPIILRPGACVGCDWCVWGGVSGIDGLGVKESEGCEESDSVEESDVMMSE